MQYETEEQQVEAIKQFWKDNGNAILLGAAIGLAGIWGWRYYSETQQAAAEAASAKYQAVVEVAAEDSNAGLQQLSDFKAENSGSSYAMLASFQEAKLAVDNGDLAKAEQALTDAVNAASTDAIKAIATIRLARVQLQQGNTDAALASISVTLPEAYEAVAEELKGDIYLEQGDSAKARMAYQAAAAKDANNPGLEMKLNNIAVASVAG